MTSQVMDRGGTGGFSKSFFFMNFLLNSSQSFFLLFFFFGVDATEWKGGVDVGGRWRGGGGKRWVGDRIGMVHTPRTRNSMNLFEAERPRRIEIAADQEDVSSVVVLKHTHKD